VAEHGRLRVQGNRIGGQHGQPVRLRGMSFFWSQWMAQYWNKDLVHWMRSDWKVSVLRAAMGVEMGGHLENPKKETQKVVEVVKAAIQEGIYIIIDWHDHNANQHQQEASSFLTSWPGSLGISRTSFSRLSTNPCSRAGRERSSHTTKRLLV